MSREEEILTLHIPHFANMLCNPVIADKTFFANETEADEHEAAKRICGQCVHKTECLNWANDHREDYGTWGGETEKERKRRWRREAVGQGNANRPPTGTNQIAAPKVVALRSKGLSNPIIAQRLGINLKGVDRALEYAKRKGMVA